MLCRLPQTGVLRRFWKTDHAEDQNNDDENNSQFSYSDFNHVHYLFHSEASSAASCPETYVREYRKGRNDPSFRFGVFPAWKIKQVP